MKKVLLLLFLLFGGKAIAQIVNIPDANFKSKLLEADTSTNIAQDIDGQNMKIDSNNDGNIQESEALAVYILNIQSSNILDLSGIEYFTNIIYLYCDINSISSLNVSNNLNLEGLYCSFNQITSLNIGANINLQYLSCSDNQLASLDVSSNVNLIELGCYSNQLTTLDVSNNTNLKHLQCGYNSLENVALGNTVNLKTFSCESNLLQHLDLSNCTELYYLDCHQNQFDSIDITQNILLSNLNCSNNQLTELDLSNNEFLLEIYCNQNQLTELDCNSNINLERLECNNNNLIYLSLKNGRNAWVILEFNQNPDLYYICTDEEAIETVQYKIDLYGYTNCHVNSYCNFGSEGVYYSIQGDVRIDVNNNGCDASDILYPNLNLSISDGLSSGTFITDQSGSYNFPIPTGIYTIVPIVETSGYFNISPPSITVDFPSQVSPLVQNFCIVPNGNHSDLEVVLIPIIPARPGFDAHYQLSYKNKGTEIETGTLSMSFDETVLDLVSTTVPIDNQVNNSFSWNFTNLNPFESRTIDFIFNVNGPMESPAVNIDDVLNFNVVIVTGNTDETPDDNIFEYNQIVIGAYDPNDKTCLQGEVISPNQVGNYVHYLIRFENTGNYHAQNIVVKDTIDHTKFDLSSLVPLSGSHLFYTRMKGNKVEFIFENINLDSNDATNDGYVLFKIKTKPNLVVGESFSNYADIYFDYNFPITTNTYTTSIMVLGIDNPISDSGFLIYPNPATDMMTIDLKNDAVIQSVELYNIAGQHVLTGYHKTINVLGLHTGTYIVNVITNKGSGKGLFVKQ